MLELVARLAGVGDVPLYRRDPELGYVLRPGSGHFLNAYGWAVNEHGMGVAEAFIPGPADIILIGDSIVQGGLFLDQPARLGSRLAAALGRQVWPVSAPSWPLLAQLRYLGATLGTGATQHIVFVTNSEDFTAITPWRGEHLQPTRAPPSVLLHAFGNLAVRLLGRFIPVPPPPPSEDWRPALAALLRRHAGPVTFALHPLRHELPAGPELAELRRAAPGARFCPVGPTLTPAAFADYIHLTQAGIQAAVLAIARCLADEEAAPSRPGRDGAGQPAPAPVPP